MTFHFFKARSRLGIRYLPYGSKAFAFGVEDAPDAILEKNFLSRFSDHKVSSFDFNKPEQYDVAEYLNLALKESLNFKKFLLSKLRRDEVQIVIGGDHSVTFPSILADIERHKENIGIIHFV